MNWTKRPEAEGYHWHMVLDDDPNRAKPTPTIQLVRFDQGRTLVLDCREDSIEELWYELNSSWELADDCRWYGPIAPPELP